MIYKSVANFENFDVVEPAIKDLDIISFERNISRECIDVPYKLMVMNNTREEEETTDIGDTLVTIFAIFTLIFCFVMCFICWI